jgi:L-ribulose-5-phosphate 3-epimerase UlaE
MMIIMTRWVPLSRVLGIPTQQPQGTSRYYKNKKVQQAPKQAIKEASKKARREKARLTIFIHGLPFTRRSSIQQTIKVY